MALTSQQLPELNVPVSRRTLSRNLLYPPSRSISQPWTSRQSITNGALGFKTERGNGSAKPGFSIIEVEALLRDKLHHNFNGIKHAFKINDTSGKLCLPRDEFRKILSTYCFPMTAHQFDALISKVDKGSNDTIKYMDFLEKYSSIPVMKDKQEKTETPVYTGTRTNNHQIKDVNIEEIEKIIKNKISGNYTSVMKALRMFDYNMDNKIQRYEMRKVLENYCLKLTDQQFDKLWKRYDINHAGNINYKEFLQRLGFRPDKILSTNTVRTALTWPVEYSQSGGNNLDTQVRLQQRQDEQHLKRLSFIQIEQEFRKRMKSNYLDLKKCFLSFDPNGSGFVSLEDLKAILINFTIPMSDQLFKRLMEKCDIKGSGRIAWELFLEKFQEPFDVGNGQTLTIGRKNHKFFPVMETQKTISADQIWDQLYKSIESHYDSFKHAFLEFDIKRTGKITRKDFRRILDRYTYDLDDNQFKLVMLKLDPNHTNSITYHQFLQLFEEKDTFEGHKWLNSVHRFNEKSKPIILPWETVEKILREKIEENWKSVSAAIVYHDFLNEGCISPVKLKRVLDKYVLPLSEDHFQHLLNQCNMRLPDGRVNYVEFLENLQICVAPGDLDGISSQIHAGNQLSEYLRFEDHLDRQMRMNRRVEDRINFCTADEILVRLTDRFSQYKTKLYDAFMSFVDKSGTGKISKRNFRKMLHTLGFVVKDEQFKELLSKLEFNNEHMSYENFISNFENRNAADDEKVRSGSHFVNPIRGDEYGATALEVESKLRTKIRDNFNDLREAFYKFDEDHNGILTKKNFRKMLDLFMIVIDHEEFEKLCENLGVTKSSQLTYQDFLDMFEIRDCESGHKWLKSVHRFNSTIPPRCLTATEVFEELKVKAHRQFADLSRAFLAFDKKKRGYIRKRELRNILSRFIITMTKEEFDKLWHMCDDDGKGYVSHQDFLKKLGASEFTPIDDGTSQNIIDASRQRLINHNIAQQKKHEASTLKQAELGVYMSAEYIEKQLRDIIRDKYKDFHAAFRSYDKKMKGYLSMNEIQKVLVDFNFFISDEEFFRLLDRIGLGTKKSRLNYFDFLRAFEEGRRSRYGARKPEFTVPGSQEFSNLSPEDAEEKLRQMVISQKMTLEKAMASFDKSHYGLIQIPEFRQVLDMFCFKLTNQQWTYFLSKVSKADNNMIPYRAFLNQFSMSSQEGSVAWLKMLKRSSLVADESPKDSDAPEENLEEKLKESVAAHFHTLASALEEADYATIGVVSKEDFKYILDNHIFKLTDEQFEQLWESLPINDFGNLEYKEFLKEYDADYELGKYQTTPVHRSVSEQEALLPLQRLHTSLSRRSGSRGVTRSSTRSGGSKSRMSTPMVNADTAEQGIKNTVLKHWKDIQKQCRKYDHLNTGTIDSTEFTAIMSNFDVNMSSDDFHKLLIKYDLKENGSFCYADFLRHFVLDLKSGESCKLRRPKLQPTILEDANENYVDAVQQLKDTVTKNWKEMIRMCRAVDQQSTGVVWANDFRRILRQFNVNLSEDEFSHMISYFDKQLNDQINYNDFIKAHIKN